MRRVLPALAFLLLASCGKPASPGSLVGDFPAPGTHAIARDTIVVWRRVAQGDGSSHFRSYSVTPGGAVQFLEDVERSTIAATEDAPVYSEKRKEFTLPVRVLEEIRTRTVLLRPQTLGPVDASGGYGGEAYPIGCAATSRASGEAGVNFINDANWGAFVLPAACKAPAARAVVEELFDRLDHAAAGARFLP